MANSGVYGASMVVRMDGGSDTDSHVEYGTRVSSLFALQNMEISPDVNTASVVFISRRVESLIDPLSVT